MKNPLVLGLDTATDVRVGLARDGKVLVSRAIGNRRAHAEQLLPLVNQVLAEVGAAPSDLTSIVVGVGPGPFTGLRVGVVSALTLAELLGIGVRGVCTLDVIAAEWVRQGAPQEFAVVADARRKEVYWATYRGDGSRVEGPSVGAPSQVPALPLAGPGAGLVGEGVGPDAVNAGLLALLGSELPDAGLEPLYLRRPDAEVPTKAKSTLLTPKLNKVGLR